MTKIRKIKYIAMRLVKGEHRLIEYIDVNKLGVYQSGLADYLMWEGIRN